MNAELVAEITAWVATPEGAQALFEAQRLAEEAAAALDASRFVAPEVMNRPMTI